jgi:hypothetical protein
LDTTRGAWANQVLSRSSSWYEGTAANARTPRTRLSR